MDQPISRSLLSDTVYERLHNNILGGVIKPGSRLRELELAENFGTSQAPIREALKRLEQEGLVTSIPHKGAFVTRLSEDDVREIYAIRGLLEGLAIRRAVENITKDDLNYLTRLIAEMRTAAQQNNIVEMTRFDSLFHMTICSISQSNILPQLISIIGGKARLAIALADRFYQHNLQDIVALHEPILEALIKRDPEIAIEANEIHLKWVLDRIDKEMMFQEPD